MTDDDLATIAAELEARAERRRWYRVARRRMAWACVPLLVLAWLVVAAGFAWGGAGAVGAGFAAALATVGYLAFLTEVVFPWRSSNGPLLGNYIRGALGLGEPPRGWE